MKNLCFFWRLLFWKKNYWHLEFLKNQIFGQRFIIFEKLRYRGRLLLKLLLHFIEYRLDQLNSKYTKIAENSGIQYFESCSQKKCLLKVWSFLVHPPQNDDPVKLFAKLNGNHLLMANNFKLHEYQTFGLMKINNMCKIWFANKIYSLWKSLVYD